MTRLASERLADETICASNQRYRCLNLYRYLWSRFKSAYKTDGMLVPAGCFISGNNIEIRLEYIRVRYYGMSCMNSDHGVG